MSEIKVNKISPATGTDITLGDSGDTFTVDGTELKVNKISPASGTAFTLGDSGDTFTVPSGGTIVNSGTATGFGGGGVWTLIKSITASSSSSVEFIDGTDDVTFDGTYKAYRVMFTEMHSSAATEMGVNFTIDGGSNWNVTRTNGMNQTQVGSSTTTWTYHTAEDNISGTAIVKFFVGSQHGTGNEDSTSGEFQIWNPASTTFHKIFRGYGVGINGHAADFAVYSENYGKVETTSAVDGLQFIMGSGNIDAGTFSLYGITT